MDRAEGFFKNILAVLLGLTLALMALEILLRVVQPIEYRVRGSKISLTPGTRAMSLTMIKSTASTG